MSQRSRVSSHDILFKINLIFLPSRIHKTGRRQKLILSVIKFYLLSIIVKVLDNEAATSSIIQAPFQIVTIIGLTP